MPESLADFHSHCQASKAVFKSLATVIQPPLIVLRPHFPSGDL